MTGVRLVLRKTRAHIPQFLCLILLLMVGVCFLITLVTIALRYEETAERYFASNSYAGVTLSGTFTRDSVEALAAQNGVSAAEGRMVQDFRKGDTTFRVISLTGDINEPHLYEGSLPKTGTECVLLQRNAEAMDLAIGDTLTLGERTVQITGLAASPEYIYLVQNERTMMAQPTAFAVLYVTGEFFPEGYNEIVALTNDNFSVDTALEETGAFGATLQEDQVNHVLYRNDLEEIGTFAYLFPFIFALLIAAVIYVMLSRTIQRDRKQIGTMKALGMPDSRIIRLYLSQFCLAALAGSLLGCFLAMLLSDTIIGIFSSMFEVPALSFAFYPALWTGTVLVAVALCAISGLIALLSLLSLLPAHALRPRIPKNGKQSGAKRESFLWKQFSWGTRYTLKNALRNKNRFFAVMLGMCGSCALLVFSLGFYDSIGATHDRYFRDFARYDVIVSLGPQPLNLEQVALPHVNSSYKALVMPVEIRDENLPLAVVEQGFDLVNIPTEKLQTGVVIPEYFAQLWQVDVGDTLRIDESDVVISAITPQYLGLSLYTSFDYMNRVSDALPQTYNSIFASSGDAAGLTAFLDNNQMDYSTIEDDSMSFASIMESMSVLIWFMIACSVVLGCTVLYALGLINLSAREYEYMFMGVMGYPHKNIMMAQIKETLLQLILAIPLGFLVGNILLESIKGEFSGSNFVISALIFPQSYALAALVVIAITAIMAVVMSRHIGRLDIVEGLKAQDE